MLKQKSTFTIVRQAARSASYLELNGTVNFDLHREVYEDALNELVRLNANMFGVLKTQNKAKARAIISQLRDYEAEMREAAQNKINALQGTAADVAKDQDANAFQDQIIELQLFLQMLDDKSFAVSKFISKGKMAAVTSAIDLNADIIEKAWKCKRFQRNLIIAALVTAAVAGVAFAGVKNRNKIKSVLLIDECGTLDLDFSAQGISQGLGFNVELYNDDDELLESVAI